MRSWRKYWDQGVHNLKGLADCAHEVKPPYLLERRGGEMRLHASGTQKVNLGLSLGRPGNFPGELAVNVQLADQDFLYLLGYFVNLFVRERPDDNRPEKPDFHPLSRADSTAAMAGRAFPP